jgi:glycosyltransferase involved in cell wall biosynthesis
MENIDPIKVLIVSYSDFGGGAHRAISRIHGALVRHGDLIRVHSTLRVIKSEKKLPRVISGYPKMRLLARVLRGTRLTLRKVSKRLTRLTGNRNVYSRACIQTGLGREIRQSTADIVLINWIGDYTVSLRELLVSEKPIAIRLADYWFLLGHTHYPRPDSRKNKLNRHFETGEADEPSGTVAGLSSLHEKFFKENVVGTVAPSTAIGSLAKKHPHLRGKLNAVVPNPIDFDFWAPIHSGAARRFLNIPPNSFSIIFGAVDGLKDPRKGGELFIQALQLLIGKRNSGWPPVRVETFGGRGIGQDRRFAWLHHHGPLDDHGLRNMYSAGSVFVSTSRFETFGNTVLESMACGTPVIAFDIPAYQDLIEHEKTGLFAESFNPEDLANQIEKALLEPNWLRRAGEAARKATLDRYSSLRVAEMYADFFSQTLALSNQK